jgi:hypothetical protein
MGILLKAQSLYSVTSPSARPFVPSGSRCSSSRRYQPIAGDLGRHVDRLADHERPTRANGFCVPLSEAAVRLLSEWHRRAKRTEPDALARWTP